MLRTTMYNKSIPQFLNFKMHVNRFFDHLAVFALSDDDTFTNSI